MRTYELPVMPVGKGRPRAKMLPNGRMLSYTPRPTATAEAEIRLLLGTMRPEFHPAGVPLEVRIYFRMTPPERRVRDEPTTKPDLDNLAKLVLDACTGILWDDDVQIVRLTLSKAYAGARGAEGIVLEVATV